MPSHDAVHLALNVRPHVRGGSRECDAAAERMQAYLMWTGVVVAFIFTSIPEWTTWVLLVAMALYDLFAVLTPRGPLQMLVNLAAEREEDIPALVYEAREVRRRRPRLRRHRGAAGSSDASAAADAGANEAVEGAAARPAVLAGADVLAAEHHAYDAGYATEGAAGTSGVGRPSGPLAESRDRPEVRRRHFLPAEPFTTIATLAYTCPAGLCEAVSALLCTFA